MGVEADCFFIAPTERAKIFLRRYRASLHESECREGGYCNARVYIEDAPMSISDSGSAEIDEPDFADDDPRWPTHCEKCQRPFAEEDERQVFTEPIYADHQGNEMTLRDAPPGAMWDAVWMGDWSRVNGSGPNLVIKLPNGGEFIPGSSASNCTRKGEDHDCWCVHGEIPKITIDKNPEPGRSTCQAGAGSIWANQGQPNDWHGFVREGRLERC